MCCLHNGHCGGRKGVGTGAQGLRGFVCLASLGQDKRKCGETGGRALRHRHRQRPPSPLHCTASTGCTAPFPIIACLSSYIFHLDSVHTVTVCMSLQTGNAPCNRPAPCELPSVSVEPADAPRRRARRFPCRGPRSFRRSRRSAWFRCVWLEGGSVGLVKVG